MDNNLCADNGLFNVALGAFFQRSCLLLTLANNVLDAFRKLRNITLLHILADFHCLFQFLEVRGLIGQNNDSLVVDLRIQNQPLIRCAVVVACDSDNAQTHTTGRCTIQSFIDVLVVRNGVVVLVIAELLVGVDLAEHSLRNARNDLRAVNDGVLDIDSDILLFIGKESIGIAVSGDIVLRQQSLQRLCDGGAQSDLIGTNIIDHQNRDIVDVSLDILNVAHEVQELQNAYILLLNAVVVVSCGLAAVDNATDGAFKESMYGVIEQVERHKCIFVLVLYALGGFLRCGKHRSFCTGEVLTGVAVFADLRHDFLQNDELIRNQRECRYKLVASGEALNIQHWIIKGKQVLQYGVFFLVDRTQKLLGFLVLRQNALFDDFINGRRGQAQSGVETALNLGEVIAGDLNHGVDGLLARYHDPNLTTAASADFLNDGLQVNHQIAVIADVLTNFVHHE